MYLERHIGQLIEVTLYVKDNWTKFFTTYLDPDNTILCELRAVDKLGIWVKEYANIVITHDKDGNFIPKENAKVQETPVSILIKWSDIETVMVYENPILFDGKKQFSTLEADDTIDDIY